MPVSGPARSPSLEANMNRFVKHAALLGLVLLVACETPATQPSFPDIHFASQPRLRLDVVAVDLQDDFHASFHAPNVEHLFPVSPEHAMVNWVHDRLEATGTTRRARARIIDASVKETRSQSVAEGITPNQRDQAWYVLTKDLMAELDRELERQMRANFTFYIQ